MTRRGAVGTTAGLALIGLLALAGCTATGASETPSWSRDASISESEFTVPDGAAEFGEPIPESSLGDVGQAADAAATTADREVVSTGRVSLSAEDPIAVATDAVRLVESAGGRVDSREEQPGTDDDDQTASATLVVRIPSAALTETLDSIAALGEVRQVQLSENDVTTQTQDVAARISALTTSTDRLTALLAGATDTDDLVLIESTLSARQEQLESLQAQQRGLADQVALATVTLAITSEAQVPEESPETFLSGLATGWGALGDAVGALLVAAGVALPWLLVLAIALGAVLVIRRLRRAPAAASTMDE